MKDQISQQNLFETKDKQVSPFLLTQKDLKFHGVRRDGSVVYFQFSPYQKCQELVDKFFSKSAPPVQPKELLDSVETFKSIIFSKKDQWRKHVK